MHDPLIRARGLGKTYGRGPSLFHAVRDVNLDVPRGGSLAIIGKSGSGKSTLMHLLALLDRPTSGTLTIDGREASDLSPREVTRLRNSDVGFVFQQFFLISHADVLANVTLPLTIAGVPRAERLRRGMHALEMLGMADKARNRATDLSGGQKQRVVIARALINTPQVIFADEPTGNLDSATGGAVADTLFALHRDHGITIVLVTHDPDLASRCDVRIRVVDGRVVDDHVTTQERAA